MIRVGAVATWGLVCVLVCAWAGDADARSRRGRSKKRDRAREKAAAATVAPDVAAPDDSPTTGDDGGRSKKPAKEKVFDFTALNIEGKMRTPQLLYFLGRAREELQRASLETRTFVPEMSRSIEEAGL